MNQQQIIQIAKSFYKHQFVQRIERWYNQSRFLFRKPYIKLLSATSVDGEGIFIRGWVLGPPGSVTSIELVVWDGSVKVISDELLWQKDDRLSRRYGMLRYKLRPRFIGLVRTPNMGTNQSAQIELRFHTKAGRFRPVVKCATVSATDKDPLAAIRKILSSVPSGSPDKRRWFDNVYGPAVQAIWTNRATNHGDPEKLVYNPELARDKPLASIVIPIYGRYDFIEYQLSAFVNDPDMFNHEILYVIDDPRLADEVRNSASTLARIYRISFSILYLPHNLGYAGANNQGARFALADKLLLLNSDVMPATKGWLAALIGSVGEQVDTSITGVRLLYEDNSIQHNGMSFFASPFVNDLWTNLHPAKGLPSDIVKSDRQFQCEAVTGACLLLSSKNFAALGGFDENYILGDYEDSDLCLKARQHGLQINLNSEIVLFHLERQSQSLVSEHLWKQQLTYYNCWRHTQKWDSDIRALKESRLRSAA